MSTPTNKATIQTNDKRRIAHALWLASMLLVFPFAAGADDVTAEKAEADVDAQLVMSAPTSTLSDEVLMLSHAKGLSWDAPAVQSPAVILWDEAGSVRRTGSGQSNAQSSGTTITVSGR